jgi:hypothetical protein
MNARSSCSSARPSCRRPFEVIECERAY